MRSLFWPALSATLWFFLAPGMVAGLVPCWLSGWRLRRPFFGWDGFRWIGSVLIVLGAAALLDTFARFVRHGRGTPAPYHPTERLVVSGLYRYVRNPMYVAVLSIVAGQGLLLGNTDVLIYAACVALGFHTFVCLYEEPTLRDRFGTQYERYCYEVQRWWPRSTPGTPDNGAAQEPPSEPQA